MHIYLFQEKDTRVTDTCERYNTIGIVKDEEEPLTMMDLNRIFDPNFTV